MSLYRLVWLARAHLSLAPVVFLIWQQDLVVVRGRLPGGLLADFADLARVNKISHGILSVDFVGENARFSFAGNIPAHVRQRFRNVWFAYPRRALMKV